MRIRTESDRRVFVGIARSAAAAAYLDGVRRAEVSEIGPWHVGYDVQTGGRTVHAARFADALDRVRHRVGRAGARLEAQGRHLEGGRDERRRLPRVAVDASIGARLDNWFWVGAGLLVAGLVFAFAAAGLIHLGVRHAEEPAQP